MKYWLKSLLLVLGIFPAYANPPAIFPKNQISLDYYNHSVFPINFPKLPKPLFWNSRFRAQSGFRISYAYCRFHTARHFSVNFGTSLANWESGSQNLFVLSGFFELRWWLFRTKTFNPYLFYSIAGPSFISKTNFAGSKLGGYFIFQDYLGAGVMIGAKRHFNLEAKVLHYSNGDLAKYNKGLQIPLVVAIGISF